MLAFAAPAAAQTPDPASLETDYEFDGSIAPSFSEPSPPPLGFGPATFAEASVDGVTRTVGAFGPEQPYRTDIGSLRQSVWAVSMLFRLDAVSGRRRVLNVQGPGDPNALYVEDGRLIYELGTSDAVGDEGLVAPGEWIHVVALRRENDDVRVFVDGALEIEFTDTANAAIFRSHGDTGFPGLSYRLRLFDGTGAEAASGQIARLRLFEGEMDDATATSLRRLDTRAAETTFPGETVVDGAMWGNRNATFASQIVDEGSSVRIESWLEDDAGTEVDGTRAVRPLGAAAFTGEQAERVRTYQSFGPYAALQDGERYDLVVVTEDASGNVSGEQRFPIAADVSPPVSLTIDGPAARTDDRSPLVSGTATVGLRDDTEVFGDLCTGTSCDPQARGFGGSSPVIGSFEAGIVGGRWSAEARRWNPDPDGDPDQLFDLPNGTYTVEVWFCDHVSNCISRTRTFQVTDPEPEKPKPVVADDGRQQQAPAPPASSPQVAVPVTPLSGLPSAQDVVAQLSRAAVKGMSAARLKGVLRGASLRLRPGRPGTVSVQVLDASRKRVLARGSGAGALKVRPTAKGRAKLRRARRLTVVVRTTFTPAGGRPVSIDRRVTLKR